MKRRIFAMAACLALSITALAGCSNVEEADVVVIDSSDLADIEYAEATADQVKLIEDALPDIKERLVLKGAKNVDLAAGLTDSTGLIKEILVMDTDMKTAKEGTYEVSYLVSLFKDKLEDIKAEKDTAKDVVNIMLKESVKVISKDEAEAKVSDGGIVLNSDGAVYVPAASGSESTGAANEAAAETKKAEAETKAGLGASENKAADTKQSNSGTDTASNKNASSNNNTSSANTAASSGNAAASHSHNWKPVYKTVHHAATGHNEDRGHFETVVIQEAWDEPMYMEVPVTVFHDFCNVCGADLDVETGGDYGLHWARENPCMGGYHPEYVPTGEYKQEIYGWIHHDAITEQRWVSSVVWVEDSAAYDEQVISGYTCDCGATK